MTTIMCQNLRIGKAKVKGVQVAMVSTEWCDKAQYNEWCGNCRYSKNRPISIYQQRKAKG